MIAANSDFPADAPRSVSDHPRDWLHTTDLLDLDDPKLRLKAQSLTQLCKDERERAMAIYGFVKRLPYTKRIKTRYPTARQVLDWNGGDGDDKATVLIALMRAARIAARIRYMEMDGQMLRGLIPSRTPAARPLAELWVGGRWVRTDTYIFDASYVAIARQRLKDEGWDCGYGIHVAAQQLWNGSDDAFLGGTPPERDPMILRELCVVSDPLELVTATVGAEGLRYRRTVRALQWNALAPGMRRAIEQMRSDDKADKGA